MQFGHRVILNGERGRDDYYEKSIAKDPSQAPAKNLEAERQTKVAPTITAVDPFPPTTATAPFHSCGHKLNDNPFPKARPEEIGLPWKGNYRPLSASLMLQKTQEASKYNTELLGQRKRRKVAYWGCIVSQSAPVNTRVRLGMMEDESTSGEQH